MSWCPASWARAPPRRIVYCVRDGQDLLCLSPAILGEYAAVLRRGGVADASIRSLLELFRDPERVLLVAPTVPVTIFHDDPGDNIFLECALAAQADFVVSGDRHLRKIETFRGIRILAPREYLALLE